MEKLRELGNRLQESVFGHKHTYRMYQDFPKANGSHVKCITCGKHFGMNHDLEIMIPWDDELAEIYKDFGYKLKE